MKKKIRIVPIGGLGEIGTNMMVIEYGDDAIIVDCGIQFADNYLPGIDLVIPDFSYVLEEGINPHGIFLTHGHEDHIGALPYFLRKMQLPVYASRFTMELVRERLTEHQLIKGTELTVVKDGQTIPAGPFRVEFIRMAHSISDAMALAIHTPEGTIIHTGDYKLDATPADGRTTDMARFRKLGQEGVLLLLGDSTNVELPGRGLSESSVREGIERMLRETSGWFIISSFASHIPRIRQILELTEKSGRKLVLAGRSIIQNIGIARKIGYLDVPDDLLVDIAQAAKIRRNKLVILSTGTQGEPRSALSRMALDQHKELKIKPGDRVVLSSRFIPGNERSIYSIINHLYRRGAEVFTTKGARVHVSGHAFRDDLREMLEAVKPKFFVPIHGEYRQLYKHIELARETGLPDANTFLLEDGHPLEIAGGIAKRLQPIEIHRSVVDGRELADIGSDLLRDRRHLSEAGIVVALVMVDSHSGEIVRGPELFARGLASEGQLETLMDDARDVLREQLEGINWEARTDIFEVQDEITLAVRRFFKSKLERKPVVIPIVIEV
ncbi:MAG: ribonuclease J [Pseudomonadota bacterium]